MASVTVQGAPARGVLRRPEATTGFWSWFTTVDHKKIGILYGVSSFVFFIVGGSEALLIRAQLVEARRHAAVGRHLQPDLHDARHHHDLPVRHADVGGVLQLPDPADDRRPRRGVPAAERLQLLGLPVRRPVHLHELVPGGRPQRRVVRLRAELRDGSRRSACRSTRPDCSSPASRPPPAPSTWPSPSSTCARRGCRCSACRCSCGWASSCSSCWPSPADHHGGPVRAALRPRVRDELLQRGEGRRPAAVAAPVLAVRPPRGLHPRSCRPSASSARSSRCSRASRCSATSSSCSAASRSASSGSACGPTTCSRWVWGRWPTPRSASRRRSSASPPA